MLHKWGCAEISITYGKPGEHFDKTVTLWRPLLQQLFPDLEFDKHDAASLEDFIADRCLPNKYGGKIAFRDNGDVEGIEVELPMASTSH